MVQLLNVSMMAMLTVKGCSVKGFSQEVDWAGPKKRFGAETACRGTGWINHFTLRPTSSIT